MTFMRVVAGIFFLFAALALASDLTRAASSGTFAMMSFAAHWNSLAPQLLASAKKLVASNLHPIIWDRGVWPVLLLPAWFLLGAIGLVFAHFGRRQRRVNIFIN